jgi:ubiquinone/menaquinone biosynthesis C-methylase UbiE
MQLDLKRSDVLDTLLATYLAGHPDLTDRWLLEQTIYTANSWRSILQLLNIQPGWNVIDVGTGFGVLPLELAAQAAVQVLGVDADESKLVVARQLHALLVGEEHFQGGGTAEFRGGDASELPSEDRAFDLGLVRLVFQHLADPRAAAEDLYRVTRPGGFVCVVDVDDQFNLAYPESSDAFARLHAAYVASLAAQGHDRHIGRKIPTILETSGFDIVTTMIWPQAQYGPASSDSLSRRFDVERFRVAREDIVAAGLLSGQDFDECLDLYATEDLAAQFTTSAQVVVVGRRPT